MTQQVTSQNKVTMQIYFQIILTVQDADLYASDLIAER